MHLHHDHDSPRALFDAHVVLRGSILSARPRSVPIGDALRAVKSKMKPGRIDPGASIRAAFRVPAQPNDPDDKPGEALE